MIQCFLKAFPKRRVSSAAAERETSNTENTGNRRDIGLCSPEARNGGWWRKSSQSRLRLCHHFCLSFSALLSGWLRETDILRVFTANWLWHDRWASCGLRVLGGAQQILKILSFRSHDFCDINDMWMPVYGYGVGLCWSDLSKKKSKI